MKLAAFLTAIIAAAPVYAGIVLPPSTDAGALQQRRIDEDERRLQLERLERKTVTDPVREDTQEQPDISPAPDAVRFMVREIRFTTSEIFSTDELEAFTSDYAGRELTFADLQLLVNSINTAYRDRRVVSAQAVIPPQDISGGIVEIRLVEGRLGDIDLSGNDTTRRGYITRRIGMQPGELVDLPALEKDMQRFNRTNDAQLRGELKPGSAFATTDLQVSVTEPPRHDASLFIDNSGPETTDEWRAGLIYNNRSVFGFRDIFSLSATRADGQESYSVGYGFPINTLGGRLNLAHYRDYIDIRHGTLATLDLTGESTGSVLTLRQPLYFGKRTQIDLLAGLGKRKSSNWISSVLLQRTDTKDASIGAEIQHVDNKGFWLATYNFTSGRAKVTDTDSYTHGRGSILRNYKIRDGWFAQGNLTYQHTSKRQLPASEQLLIGGEGSVRGYPVGTYAGDRGYGLMLELHHPLGSLGSTDSAVAVAANGFFFADHARVKPNRPPNSTLRSHEELSSLGWGINATIGKRITTRLALAYTLNTIPLESRRHYVHFQLGAKLF